MAVRLTNLHRLPLRVDLRGGEELVLAPGQRSAALREELLYDNCHLAAWERAGWVLREPARLQEVSAESGPAPAPAASASKEAASRSGRGGRRPGTAEPKKP
jgi:hypothetical protein